MLVLGPVAPWGPGRQTVGKRRVQGGRADGRRPGGGRRAPISEAPFINALSNSTLVTTPFTNWSCPLLRLMLVHNI